MQYIFGSKNYHVQQSWDIPYGLKIILHYQFSMLAALVDMHPLGTRQCRLKVALDSSASAAGYARHKG